MTEQGGSALLVRMPTALHEAIQAKAVQEDRSMAAVVRQALRAYIGEGLASVSQASR